MGAVRSLVCPVPSQRAAQVLWQLEKEVTNPALGHGTDERSWDIRAGFARNSLSQYEPDSSWGQRLASREKPELGQESGFPVALSLSPSWGSGGKGRAWPLKATFLSSPK